MNRACEKMIPIVNSDNKQVYFSVVKISNTVGLVVKALRNPFHILTNTSLKACFEYG